MQVIEHELKAEAVQVGEAPDHSAPFASDLKSRFRRL
jgi:hypothetical protein